MAGRLGKRGRPPKVKVREGFDPDFYRQKYASGLPENHAELIVEGMVRRAQEGTYPILAPDHVDYDPVRKHQYYQNRKERKMQVEAVKHSNTEKVTEVTFPAILEKMKAIHAEKNKNYGDSFTALFDEFGDVASIIRLTDKLSRYKSLVKQGSEGTADESINDTLMDMANYAVMTIVARTRRNK